MARSVGSGHPRPDRLGPCSSAPPAESADDHLTSVYPCASMPFMRVVRSAAAPMEGLMSASSARGDAPHSGHVDLARTWRSLHHWSLLVGLEDPVSVVPRGPEIVAKF